MSANHQRAGRRSWMLVVGVVLLVGLLGAAAALWVASGERRADNVAGFARAPVGCDTTLDFDATGTFVLYVETSGELDQLAGECDAALRYDRNANDLPELDVTLRDPSGETVDLEAADSSVYDVDGFVGVAVRQVQIEVPGDHILTVGAAEGAPFAVAVGRSVDQGVGLLRAGAVAAAIASLVLGGLFLVLGSRRGTVPPAAAAPWAPEGQQWPASPPGFPSPPPTTGASRPPGPSLTPPAAGQPGAQPSPWAPPSPPSS